MKANLEYLRRVSSLPLHSSNLQLSLVLPHGRVDAEGGVEPPRDVHAALSFICVSYSDSYPPVHPLTEEASRTLSPNIHEREQRRERFWFCFCFLLHYVQ